MNTSDSQNLENNIILKMNTHQVMKNHNPIKNLNNMNHQVIQAILMNMKVITLKRKAQKNQKMIIISKREHAQYS